jgi:serine phosphatase RsbU (regulator of sigma subunit)
MHVAELTLGDLLRAADAGPVDSLPVVLRDAFARWDVAGIVLYVGDYQQTLLRPAPGSFSSRGAPRAVDVAGTAAGRAFVELVPYEEDDGDLTRIWVPVVERAEPLGVLELELRSVDDLTRRAVTDIGVLLGHLLVTARNYTDVYELLRRRRAMNIAAEMHWDLLPARNYVGPSVSVCGDIEPAYEVGGDTFDYCINDRTLDLTLMDAMGHGGEAALLSAHAMGAYRYGRRRSEPLARIAEILDESLLQRFTGERFVTGLFARLDIPSGNLEWVSAGHESPLLLRDGSVHHIDERPSCCPLGLDLVDRVEPHVMQLRAGDCLLLYSDGVVDAKDPEGAHFTLEALVELVQRHLEAGEPVGAIVHRVIAEVMKHSRGPLKDDATVLLVELLDTAGSLSR